MDPIDRTALRLRNPASTGAAAVLHSLAWLAGLGFILFYVLPWLAIAVVAVGLVLIAIRPVMDRAPAKPAQVRTQQDVNLAGWAAENRRRTGWD